MDVRATPDSSKGAGDLARAARTPPACGPRSAAGDAAGELADLQGDGARMRVGHVAVVVLDKAVKGIAPAKLPRADALADLPGTQQFTSVGYGAYAVTNQPGAHAYLYNDVRGVATGTLNAVNPAWLRISMNPSTGNGGTCYGDSGGPNFLGASDVVAATTITGDAVCRSTNVDYRLDTPSARAFLKAYVALP